MKPRCAEEDVPTAANLNLHRGRHSRVGWHRDDEPLFGECGEAKLIVSVSFGTRALFKWKGKSCPGIEAGSCWLEHGDLFRTSFFTARIPAWNRRGLTLRSVGSSNMLRLVLSLGQGWRVVCQRVRRVHPFLSRSLWRNGASWVFWVLLVGLWSTPSCARDLGHAGVPFRWTRPWAEVCGSIVFVTFWEFTG